MALRFLNGEVSELCLGKPELRWIPTTAKISDALTALKRSTDTHISVWSCGGDGGKNGSSSSCVCVGKVSMADVILFLCREENLVDPIKALKSPVSDVLCKGSSIVRPLEPNSSLLESIDCILEGAQNLVITTQNHTISNSRQQKHVDNNNNNNNNDNKPSSPPQFTCPHHENHCWLTQEDVIRFLFNSIASFSPIPTNTIESLNVIDRHNILTVLHTSPASSALRHLNTAVANQTSIAVVDESHKLIGEISPFTLACCHESTSAAILTLSAYDLMAYVDCGGPPHDLIRSVRSNLIQTDRKGFIDLIDELSSISTSSSCSSSGSSDEECLGRAFGSGRYNPLRRSEATLCSPKSSLVAVMVQALAYRVSSVWVVEEDCTLIGSVTFAGMLKVFRGFSGGRHSKPEMESNNLFKY